MKEIIQKSELLAEIKNIDEAIDQIGLKVV